MKVLDKIQLEDILIIDTETTTVVPELKLDTPLFEAWAYTNSKLNLSNDELIKLYSDKGALYPEFSKIACVSVGRLFEGNFVTASFNGPNEKEILLNLNKTLSKSKWKIAGHSIKSFDLPFIFKRSIVNGIVPHKLVDVSGEKPWTMDWIIDTAELWGYTSLIALTNVLGIPSPKDDISGSDVPKLYWEGDNIERISVYCEKDVKAVYDILYRFKNISDVPVPLVEKPLLTAMFEGNFSESDQAILNEIFENSSPDKREKISVILNAIVSTAKGKVTRLTKAHIKQFNSITVPK